MSDDFDEFTRSRSQGSVIVTEENLQRCAIDLAGLVLPPVKCAATTTVAGRVASSKDVPEAFAVASSERFP